jgi:hypothetical protein
MRQRLWKNTMEPPSRMTLMVRTIAPSATSVNTSCMHARVAAAAQHRRMSRRVTASIQTAAHMLHVHQQLSNIAAARNSRGYTPLSPWLSIAFRNDVCSYLGCMSRIDLFVYTPCGILCAAMCGACSGLTSAAAEPGASNCCSESPASCGVAQLHAAAASCCHPEMLHQASCCSPQTHLMASSLQPTA